MNMELI